MIHVRLMGQTTIGNKGCLGMSEFRNFYKNLLEKDMYITVLWVLRDALRRLSH